MQARTPYWRLSGFYFFYFALLGAWLPYWALYLKSLQFSSLQIGLLSALVMVTKVVAPNIWGWIADSYHCRTRIIRLGAMLAALCFLGVFLSQQYWWLCLVVASYSFFWNAVLSQFDVLTLSHLEGRHDRYSLIRVWGSVGFIIAVMGVGAWLDYHPIFDLLIILSVLLSGIWLCSLLVSERPQAHQLHTHLKVSLGSILRRPPVMVFFISSFLLQVSHGPYYTFFSIFMESNGYSKTVTGFYWSLGVVVEVLLFLVMHRILAATTLRSILLWSLWLSVARWLIIAFLVDSSFWLIVAQCLHAASFGSFHAGAVETVRRWFPRHHGQGMALYSGLSFGAGGALGAYYSGLLWDVSAVLCFVVAAATALLAGGLFWRYFREPQSGDVASVTTADSGTG